MMRGKATTKPTIIVVPARDKFSQNELNDLKSTFDLFDEEGTGFIDPV